LFIEQVYNKGMLRGRCKYFLIDDFDKENALKFMDFLAKEILNKELSNEDKELIYSYVGGKPGDIKYAVEECGVKNLKDVLESMLDEEISNLDTFLEVLDYSEPEVIIGSETYRIKKDDVVKALKLFKDKYEISKKEIPTPVYIYLVSENILFLNPRKRTLKPQSYLVWNAIKRIL